jgi:hypothetical protein
MVSLYSNESIMDHYVIEYCSLELKSKTEDMWSKGEGKMKKKRRCFASFLKLNPVLPFS